MYMHLLLLFYTLLVLTALLYILVRFERLSYCHLHCTEAVKGKLTRYPSCGKVSGLSPLTALVPPPLLAAAVCLCPLHDLCSRSGEECPSQVHVAVPHLFLFSPQQCPRNSALDQKECP